MTLQDKFLAPFTQTSQVRASSQIATRLLAACAHCAAPTPADGTLPYPPPVPNPGLRSPQLNLPNFSAQSGCAQLRWRHP